VERDARAGLSREGSDRRAAWDRDAKAVDQVVLEILRQEDLAARSADPRALCTSSLM